MCSNQDHPDTSCVGWLTLVQTTIDEYIWEQIHLTYVEWLASQTNRLLRCPTRCPPGNHYHG